MLTRIRLLSLSVVLALLVSGCVMPIMPAGTGAGMGAGSEEMALPTPQPGLITAEQVRSRPAPLEGGNGAAFMLLLNGTDAAVTLQSATGNVAAVVELHETTAGDDGVLRMIPRPEGFEVPAGGVVELKPGGKHVMLMGLVAPLETGNEFELTLNFSDGSTLVVNVPVVEMAMPESMPGMEGMEGMEGHDMKGGDH